MPLIQERGKELIRVVNGTWVWMRGKGEGKRGCLDFRGPLNIVGADTQERVLLLAYYMAMDDRRGDGCGGCGDGHGDGHGTVLVWSW